MVASPRLFIVDFDLVGYPGHFFNQVFGFREAARARGIATRIYISRRAEPAIAAELDAQAILPVLEWLNGDLGSGLESLADAHHFLTPLWDDLRAEKISESDVLVVTSSRPQAIYGIAQWLRERPPAERPAVFFRFLGPEFYDFEKRTFGRVAWTYRFVSRVIHTSPGAERMFFTLNNVRALAHLEALSLRKVFYLPVPKYYGAVGPAEIRPAGPLTIYIYVNVRSGEISDRIVDLIGSILSRHDDVRFLVRFSKDAPGEGNVRRKAAEALADGRVEIVPSEQDHVDYLATIARSDVLLLPYGPVEYRGIVSGVFCETAAMGKIAIIPAETWMADHVEDSRASGVLFASNTLSYMVAAVEKVILERGRLQALADSCANPFREENSCASNLDGMIALAAKAADMRLPQVPLTDATDALGSQHYFGEGWSVADEGFGTWSDGERAEMNFTIAPDAPPLFFNALVRPFLVKGHSRLDVSLTANGVSVAEWSFDISRTADRDWSWRHVQLPAAVSASGEIQIAMHIRSPASPRSLGLSTDSRNLGIAIRQFSLEPEAHAPGGDQSERPTVLARLRRRIRRKLRQVLSPSE
ncbi:MAG: glycosyltransferase family 1 protein [Afipia sp.]|nr:MAG: glycosyltransferase family 1 protein [Afipia sp.]